jgi:hypothetical protein
MTPEQRDALIDATVEACAKIAENFHQQMKGAVDKRVVLAAGALIAAAIRREFAKP